MRTAEEHFRQANDPNGGGGGGGIDGSSTAFGGVDVGDIEAGRAAAAGGGRGAGEGGGGGPSAISGAEEEEGSTGGRRRRRNNRGSSMMAPTILMRESSTLFRRASVSLCRRLGEADGSYLDPDVSALDVSSKAYLCTYQETVGGAGRVGFTTGLKLFVVCDTLCGVTVLGPFRIMFFVFFTALGPLSSMYFAFLVLFFWPFFRVHLLDFFVFVFAYILRIYSMRTDPLLQPIYPLRPR